VLAGRLEITKHQLQLDYQKMSIIFEHQKDSFRKVLVAMHLAIGALESGADDAWHPIQDSQVDAFRSVISEGSLFMDTASDQALRAFVAAMGDAVEPTFEPPPEQEVIRRAHSVAAFILERLSEHFRSRVGLAPSHVNPLRDIELLGACRLINRYHFPQYDLPTKGPLAFRRGQTAAELVATAQQTSICCGPNSHA
jgi:hypothetical protein